MKCPFVNSCTRDECPCAEAAEFGWEPRELVEIVDKNK
jgi:hypothetical protein